MSSHNETADQTSLAELEKIEGNYYVMDFFVSFSLVLFALWVRYSEESFGWTVFIGLVSFAFLICGIKNWIKSLRSRKQNPS